MTTKKTEEMTAAEAVDAIFGEGAAEDTWTGEDLKVARQPYTYTPPPAGRNVRLKVTPSGHVSPTHPAAPLGRHNGVRTVQINSVPPSVPLAAVVRLYSLSVDLGDSPSWEFDRLGIGRILR